jgi:putative transposase
VHLVFVTKYRKKVFTPILLAELKTILFKVCADFNATLVEFYGERDHVHLLVYYPTTVPVSGLVNSLKGVSSRLLRQFPAARKGYYKNVLWSPSYFASSCGGAPSEILKQYIQQQAAPL